MNLENFYTALQIMGYGMAGIFAVILLIFAMIKLLIALFPPKSEEKL